MRGINLNFIKSSIKLSYKNTDEAQKQTVDQPHHIRLILILKT